MYRNSLLIVGCVLVLLGKSQVKTLSLNEAMVLAQKDNYQMQIAQLDLIGSEKKVTETLAMGLPQISGSASYQDFIKQAVNLVPAEFFGGAPGEFTELIFGTKQTASAGITISQLLFDGSYIIGLQASRFYVEISRDNMVKNSIDVADNVTRSYYMALAATKNEQIWAQNKTNTEHMLSDMQQLYDNGMIEKTDFEQITLLHANAVNSYKNAVKQVEITLKILKYRIGMSINEPIILSDNLEQFTDSLYADEVIQKYSLSNSIDYKMTLNNERSKSLLLKVEKMKYLPSIGGFLSYSDNSYSDKFDFFQQHWFPTAVWGVNINVPIFSSFMRSSRVSQAKVELEKAKILTTQVSESLLLQVQKSQVDYSYALDNFHSQQENLALAKNIQDNIYKKFLEGNATSIELTQIQMQYVQTQANYIQSLLLLLNAKADMDKSFNNYTK